MAYFPNSFFRELLARDTMTIEDLIRRAPSMGVQVVELYPTFLERTDPERLAGLRHCADDVGVALAYDVLVTDFVNPAPAARDKAARDMQKAADVMAELSPTSSWRSACVLSRQPQWSLATTSRRREPPKPQPPRQEHLNTTTPALRPSLRRL